MIAVINLKRMLDAVVAENLIHVFGSLEHYVFALHLCHTAIPNWKFKAIYR